MCHVFIHSLTTAKVNYMPEPRYAYRQMMPNRSISNLRPPTCLTYWTQLFSLVGYVHVPLPPWRHQVSPRCGPFGSSVESPGQLQRQALFETTQNVNSLFAPPSTGWRIARRQHVVPFHFRFSVIGYGRSFIRTQWRNAFHKPDFNFDVAVYVRRWSITIMTSLVFSLISFASFWDTQSKSEPLNTTPLKWCSLVWLFSFIKHFATHIQTIKHLCHAFKRTELLRDQLTLLFRRNYRHDHPTVSQTPISTMAWGASSSRISIPFLLNPDNNGSQGARSISDPVQGYQCDVCKRP